MRIPSPTFLSCAALLLCCLLLEGCASRIVRTVPLPENRQAAVLARFDAFARRQCAQTLDADLTLELNLLGKTERVGGMLQAQMPASLRYSTLGPLGRSLYIMVTDGTDFTMVDNRKATAYTGRIGSRFWHKYFPADIRVEDLLPLLTGRPAEQGCTIEDVKGDKTEPEVAWLFPEPVKATGHIIRFDPAAGIILRHLLKDDEDNILLDVAYNRYDHKTTRCAMPMEIQVRGKSITGTLTLRYDRIYPASDLAPSIFELTLPKHYRVQPVD